MNGINDDPEMSHLKFKAKIVSYTPPCMSPERITNSQKKTVIKLCGRNRFS